VNFLKPGTAVRSNFIEIYRFFSIFSVFRPALEPDKSTEKPGCIEGLFSGMAPGTPKTTKNGQKVKIIEKLSFFNKIEFYQWRFLKFITYTIF
jgi:hypothetical protein